MPAGDAQRAWFPEMTDALQKLWTPEMSWEECASLCKSMTSMRAEIKTKKHIRGPRMRCKKCNQMSEMILLPIGIRSLLYALRKLEVLSDEELSFMDKDWKPSIRKPLPWDGREIINSIDKMPIARTEALERNPAGR